MAYEFFDKPDTCLGTAGVFGRRLGSLGPQSALIGDERQG
jgi:hypothetical protein